MALSGSRRVGKSYLLKQLAAQLIKNKIVPSQNILNFAFSTNHDEPEIIRELVFLFLKKYSQPGKKSFIFLDEAQFISYWPDQIKFFYDQNLAVKFVVTGSTSLFYKQKSKESLLGRMVKFPVGVLSFAEYLLFKKISRPGKRAEFIESLPLLRTEFRKYLVDGQFPELVTSPQINSTEYLSAVVDQLVNFDIPYLYSRLDRTLFTNFVKTLSFELGNEISLNKLATGLESKRAIISEYLRILEETGYFDLCLNGYFHKMRSKLSGVKKIYSLNLNLALSINGFDKTYFNDSRILGHYAKNYVYLRLREKFGRGIEYYGDRTREIDFLAGGCAWEVKFGKISNLPRYEQIAGELKLPLVVVTENEMEQTKTLSKIPIYLL